MPFSCASAGGGEGQAQDEDQRGSEEDHRPWQEGHLQAGRCWWWAVIFRTYSVQFLPNKKLHLTVACCTSSDCQVPFVSCCVLTSPAEFPALTGHPFLDLVCLAVEPAPESGVPLSCYPLASDNSPVSVTPAKVVCLRQEVFIKGQVRMSHDSSRTETLSQQKWQYKKNLSLVHSTSGQQFRAVVLASYAHHQ